MKRYLYKVIGKIICTDCGVDHELIEVLEKDFACIGKKQLYICHDCLEKREESNED